MSNLVRLDELEFPACGRDVAWRMGPFNVEWQHLYRGMSRGVERLVIRSGGNTISFLPTRGMGLESVVVNGVRFGWDSPVPGPIHPQWVPVDRPDGLGWLSGFSELLCRCGLASNGPPVFDDRGRLKQPLHGRIANLPAVNIVLELVPGGIMVRGEVVDCQMHLAKWKLATNCLIHPDCSRIELLDEVTNLGGTRNDFQMLYHFNFGPPLMEAGAAVHIPATRIVPRNQHAAKNVDPWNVMSEPTGGGIERVWFVEPAFREGECRAVMVNRARDIGAGIDFRHSDSLRCFTLWKNEVDERDGYVCGMEPGTNWPNGTDFERAAGRSVMVEPGESHRMGVKLHFATGMNGVANLLAPVLDVENPPADGHPASDICEM